MSLTGKPAAPAPAGARVPLPARIDSAMLLAGQRELVIVHQGTEYRLRITRQDKLILTK